ncbi:MAG: glucose-6-phosphate isomerase [Myxococcota bacterium]
MTDAADPNARWTRFRALSLHDRDLGFSVDTSAMMWSRADFDALVPALEAARNEMAALEGGAIANVDEDRMVGHYWLRDARLAPTAELKTCIEEARRATEKLAAGIRAGTVAPAGGGRFRTAVVVGIGGSSLGPMLVCDALEGVSSASSPSGDAPAGDPLALRFFDNTDPDGFDRLRRDLDLATTLTIVISKSGGTKETRNGMLEMKAAYEAAGLAFGPHSVAVTSAGSTLDETARAEGFIARLPMYDWIGGRTSVTSPVGLLPAALAGVDIAAFLDGAAAMDVATRKEPAQNPAAWLAASWFHARGKAMVMLPYKDRLALISRYLQQLVMESLGKARNRQGDEVHAGIAVYGNKGSTDQHAYVQQLLDGPNDFFVTFIHIARAREGASIEVEPGVTSGDYLFGFLRGTREALSGRGRGSITLTLPVVDARRVGALVALYERAVGFYASLVDVNAYHQPGVESGKKAAARVIALQASVRAVLDATPCDAETVAARAGTDDVEAVAAVLAHLVANGAAREEDPAAAPWDQRFATA